MPSSSRTLLTFRLGRAPGRFPPVTEGWGWVSRGLPAERGPGRGPRSCLLGPAARLCAPRPLPLRHCLAPAPLASNSKACQPEAAAWGLPGKPLPVFSGGNCGSWCVAACSGGTRDMFKEGFPPPIAEAGGKPQECLRARLGLSIPREAAGLE